MNIVRGKKPNIEVVSIEKELVELGDLFVSLEDSMSIQSAEGAAFKRAVSEQDGKISRIAILVNKIINQSKYGIGLIERLHAGLPENAKAKAAYALARVIKDESIQVRVSKENQISIERLTGLEVEERSVKREGADLSALSIAARFFRMRSEFINGIRRTALHKSKYSISMILSGSKYEDDNSSRFDLEEIWVIKNGDAETLNEVRSSISSNVEVSQYLGEHSSLVPAESISIRVGIHYPDELKLPRDEVRDV